MQEIIIEDEAEYYDEKKWAEEVYSPLISRFYMYRYQLRRFVNSNSREEARKKTIKDIAELAETLELKRNKNPKD